MKMMHQHSLSADVVAAADGDAVDVAVHSKNSPYRFDEMAVISMDQLL